MSVDCVFKVFSYVIIIVATGAASISIARAVGMNDRNVRYKNVEKRENSELKTNGNSDVNWFKQMPNVRSRKYVCQDEAHMKGCKNIGSSDECKFGTIRTILLLT